MPGLIQSEPKAYSIKVNYQTVRCLLVIGETKIIGMKRLYAMLIRIKCLGSITCIYHKYKVGKMWWKIGHANDFCYHNFIVKAKKRHWRTENKIYKTSRINGLVRSERLFNLKMKLCLIGPRFINSSFGVWKELSSAWNRYSKPHAKSIHWYKWVDQTCMQIQTKVS